MLATLPSQIQMLSYGFASSCIWIFCPHLVWEKTAIRPHVFIRPYITSYGWKIRQTGPLEFFMALPEKIFCLGLSIHFWLMASLCMLPMLARQTPKLCLGLSSNHVFCPHFVPAKKRPLGIQHL